MSVSTLASTMPKFKTELKKLLSAQELSPHSYAVKIGHKGNGLVIAVLEGRRRVPLDDLKHWLDALRLPPEQYNYMWRLGLRDYAPKYVDDILQSMDELKKNQEELKRWIKELFGLDLKSIATDPAQIRRLNHVVEALHKAGLIADSGRAIGNLLPKQ